jgi:predicted RNase H-like HicB family nuclease
VEEEIGRAGLIALKDGLGQLGDGSVGHRAPLPGLRWRDCINKWAFRASGGSRYGVKEAANRRATREGPLKYKIALRKTDAGYSVFVPGLPGCWSQGATEEEAIANVKDAIHEYLAARDDLFDGATVREVEVTA